MPYSLLLLIACAILTANMLISSQGEQPATLDDLKKVETKEGESPETKFAALQEEFDTLIAEVRKDIQAAKTDEERKAIADAFQPKYNLVVARMFALAKANPKAKFAFDALVMAVQAPTTSNEAIDLIIEHFGDDSRILGLLPWLNGHPSEEKALAKLETSNNTDIRGGLSYLKFTTELERAESPKVTAVDREKVFAEAPDKLVALVKVYGDVTVTGPEGPAKLADMAEKVTYMLDHLRVGKTLPDVDCPTLNGEKTGKVSDYRGNVVVLDIWATWCGPCRQMIPHEREIVKKFENKPFKLIGIAHDPKGTLVEFLEKTEMPWTHWYVGPKEEVLKKYQVRFFPTIYVLDGKGVVRYKNIRDEELESAVEELLNEAEKG